MLGSLGFKIRYNLGKKVRFLGYDLVVDRKRVIPLAPTDSVKKRFESGFKEHFDSVKQEMGSQRLMVQQMLEYLESLFIGLTFYFELIANRSFFRNNLYSQMTNTAFGLIEQRFGLPRDEVLTRYGPAFYNMRSEQFISSGRHNLVNRMKRTVYSHLHYKEFSSVGGMLGEWVYIGG